MSLSYGIRRGLESAGFGKMNYKIFGMPYNYTDITDPGGRVFNRTMFSNMSVLTITPGSPDMAGTIMQTLKGIANFSGLGEFDNRKWKFQPEWSEYKGYVNAMSQLLFNKMMSSEYGGNYEARTITDFLSDKGINQATVDSNKGVIVDRVNALSFTEGMMSNKNRKDIERRISELNNKTRTQSEAATLALMQYTKSGSAKDKTTLTAALKGSVTEQEIINEFKEIDELKKKYAKEYQDNINKQMTSFNALSKTEAGLSTQLQKFNNVRANKTMAEGVMFYMEASSSVSETISSSYSSTTSETDATSAERREAEIARNKASWWTSGFSSAKEAMANLASHVHGGAGADTTAINSGEPVIYPMKWDSSSHRKSYNISMRFTSPYGDSYSVFDNIMFPLILLMAFTLPKQGRQLNSYTAPFIIRAEAPGNFLSDMGIVESVSWRKGTQQGDWTHNGLPLSMEVTLVITDLYPVMSMADSAAELNRNGSISYYLANMAGITSEENDAIALSVTEKYNRIRTSIKYATSFDNLKQSFVDKLVDVANYITS